MTMWDLKLLHEYWDEYPPVHLLIAGFIGFKAKKKPSKDEMIALPPGLALAFTKDGHKPVKKQESSLPAPIFDFDEMKRQVRAKRG